MRYLPLLFLLFAACQSENPLVEKYEADYLATRTRLNADLAELDPLFDQLPEPVRVSLRGSVVDIQELSLEEFLIKNEMTEVDLQASLGSINGLLDRFERSRNWTPSPEQRELYAQLQAKVREHREPVERFVAKQRQSLDPQKMTMAILFDKMLTMDVETFIRNSMADSTEFSLSMRESLDQWDNIYLAVLLSDMEGVIQEN